MLVHLLLAKGRARRWIADGRHAADLVGLEAQRHGLAHAGEDRDVVRLGSVDAEQADRYVEGVAVVIRHCFDRALLLA